jgi:hypothetical protein
MMNNACGIAALIPPLPPIDDCSCWGFVGRARMYGRVPPRHFGYGCRMHKFKIGQHLFPARSVGLNVSDGAYVIVKGLPERYGEFEYQIKNLAEPDERIVRESQLRPNPWHRSRRPAGYRQ